MWAPWHVALISGAAAGCATALPQTNSDALYVLTTAALVAVLVCLFTGLGLWLSRRPRLPAVPALGVAAATAVIAYLSAVPMQTHAEVVDMPAVQTAPISMTSAYLVGLAVLVLPAIIAFVTGRVFGVPPNTSLERTRDR
jgi:predicted membrane-bound dolichyl-phosphate-mannose-protein mannosyltransferase